MASSNVESDVHYGQGTNNNCVMRSPCLILFGGLVNSPVTQLAMNLKGLNTWFESTPKKGKGGAANKRTSTPRNGFGRILSFEPLSTTNSTSPALHEKGFYEKPALYRFSSMPLPESGTLGATSYQDDNTAKSTLKAAANTRTSMQNDQVSSHTKYLTDNTSKLSINYPVDEQHFLDGKANLEINGPEFQFVAPKAPVSCKLLRSLSMPQGNAVQPSSTELTLPMTRKKSSLTAGVHSDAGDAIFVEQCDMEDGFGACHGLYALFNAPVISDQPIHTQSAHRSLSMLDGGQSDTNWVPRKTSSSREEVYSPVRIFKRKPSLELDITEHMIKKCKILNEEKQAKPVVKSTVRLQRSVSEGIIKSALELSDTEENLIGDFSMPHALPLVHGKHQDLKSISSHTLAQVINGEYSDVIERVVIVDCRYPYEYVGGHVKGAVNCYTKDNIVDVFLKHKLYQSDNPSKRTVLIFHCEFSSERGPTLSRYLRNKDRQANKDGYPSLYYPEIYLLHGGYKDFFSCQKELCVPQSYLEMADRNYGDQYKHFRAKSKSWAGERIRFALTPLRI